MTKAIELKDQALDAVTGGAEKCRPVGKLRTKNPYTTKDSASDSSGN